MYNGLYLHNNYNLNMFTIKRGLFNDGSSRAAQESTIGDCRWPSSAIGHALAHVTGPLSALYPQEEALFASLNLF